MVVDDTLTGFSDTWKELKFENLVTVIATCPHIILMRY